MKTKLLRIRDGARTLYYRTLAAPRADGAAGTLVGYRRAGRTFWY